jgi:hypothetical protein
MWGLRPAHEPSTYLIEFSNQGRLLQCRNLGYHLRDGMIGPLLDRLGMSLEHPDKVSA